jgi:hypothetical protein
MKKFVNYKINDENKIALIFGWTLSKNKFLNKYSSIYHEKNWSTVQLASKETSVTNEKIYEKKMKIYLEILYELFDFSKDKEIIIHLFSNGGIRHYIGLLEESKKDEKYKSLRNMIKGVIFDSCPADSTMKSGALAMTEGMTNPWMRCVSYYIMYFFMFFFMIQFLWSSEKMNIKIGIPKLIDEEVHNNIPLLFIYSERDTISSYEYIEEFINKLNKKEKCVKVLKFKDSVIFIF